MYENLKIHSIALLAAFIIQNIFLIFYNKGSKIIFFNKEFILIELLLMTISMLLCLIPFSMINI